MSLIGQKKKLCEELTTLKSNFNHMHIETKADTPRKDWSSQEQISVSARTSLSPDYASKRNRKQFKHSFIHLYFILNVTD
jgi:hypothetical protein